MKGKELYFKQKSYAEAQATGAKLPVDNTSYPNLRSDNQPSMT